MSLLKLLECFFQPFIPIEVGFLYHLLVGLTPHGNKELTAECRWKARVVLQLLHEMEVPGEQCTEQEGAWMVTLRLVCI